MSHTQVPLAEVQVGDMLAHVVRIHSVKLIKGTNKTFLSLKISDKSGIFDATKWGEGRGDATEEERKKYEAIKIAVITGNVDDYRGKSLKIKTIAAGDIDQKVLDEVLGPEPSLEAPAESPPKKTGGWSFKTKAEVDFDNLLKAQKPLREHGEGATLKHLLKVCSVGSGKTKGGLPYIDFALGDALTSPMKARLWRVPDDAYETLKNTKIVLVEGVMELYPNNPPTPQSTLQIKFDDDHITVISDATEADINGLTMSSPYPIRTLANGIWNIIQTFQDPYLKQLCESLLKDPKNKDFRFAPAGVSYHHSWRSGLIEHTYRLLLIVDDFVKLYNETPLTKNRVKLNRDAILTVCLYHDFFKCFEYTIDCGYAPAGNLLKHLSRGVVDIGARSAQIKDFPKLYREVLAHCVGAHHGKKEWDAIELPGCPEALVLHWFDNLCSKLDPTITELNLLKSDSGFSTTMLKPLNSIPYIGSCKKEKIPPFASVAVTEVSRQGYLSAIKQMLENLREPKLKELSLKVFENNAKAFLADSSRLELGSYDCGLVEYIYRTMHFLGNFINSYNDKSWPGNTLYIDSDYSVAGAFLQSAFRFKESDPFLETVGSGLLAIGELTSQIEGFSDDLRNLVCQIIASQGDPAPESAICPDSIANQFYLPLIFKLDSMNLALSSDTWTADGEVELFGKKIRPGICELEK